MFSLSSFGVLVGSPSPHCSTLCSTSSVPKNHSSSLTLLSANWLHHSCPGHKQALTPGQGAGCPQGVPSAPAAPWVPPWLGCSTDLSCVHCKVSVYSYCVDVESQPVPMDTVECRERRAASLLYRHVGLYIPQILGSGGLSGQWL